MCSRWLVSGLALLLFVSTGCSQKATSQPTPLPPPAAAGVVDTALVPGILHASVTTDPKANAYYDNADAVVTGKRLFTQYNCSGCHSDGGGGMGPDLMDD